MENNKTNKYLTIKHDRTDKDLIIFKEFEEDDHLYIRCLDPEVGLNVKEVNQLINYLAQKLIDKGEKVDLLEKEIK